MAWFRRKPDADSLDPQYLLDQAHALVGVEMFRKIVDTARAGDNVGLLLRSVSRDEIARGDVLER